MIDEAKQLAAARRALVTARGAFARLTMSDAFEILNDLIGDVDDAIDRLAQQAMATPAPAVPVAEGAVRICDLDQSVLNKRIKVVQAQMSEAERRGHCDDSRRLAGQTGIARSLVKFTGGMAQLRVLWDNPEVTGSLMLADQDVVEIVVKRKGR